MPIASGNAGSDDAGGGAVPDETDPLGATALAQLRGLATGAWSSRELVAGCLHRIAAVDASGPTLRAVIEVDPDALATAEERDRERAAGRSRGLLHGVPVLIKDNIDTAGDADRSMRTTAGSLALLDTLPVRDAMIVTRLRDAGAVIVAKTNLSEWANFRSPRSTSGWSGRGGQTVNPYALDRTPSGSSSGSGVAVAARLAALAVGTETDGSILCPAAANGVVGVKPTLGVVPQDGIVPIAHSQDTAGPMARSVADAALLLAVLAGGTLPGASAAAAFVEQLTGPPAGLGTLRLGVVRSRVWGVSPDTDGLVEAAISRLSAGGAAVVDDLAVPDREQLGEDEMTALLHEFHHDLEAYLSRRPPGGPRNLPELIAFNEGHAAQELPYFGQELLERAAETGSLTEPGYLRARERARRVAGPEGIDKTLRESDVQVLLLPTMPPAAKIDHVNGDHRLPAAAQLPAVAGYPSVTVPVGLVHGLPVGVTIMGPRWAEATVLRVARAVEATCDPLPAPGFRPPRLG